MKHADYFVNKPLSPLAQDPGKTPVFTVQLLGFEAKERTLFVSMFNLSKIRPMRYVDFDPKCHPYADFYIISADSPAAVHHFQKLDKNTCGGVLFVGNGDVPTSSPVIRKPIKWAEVLMRLDELPRPRLPAQVHELLEAGVITEKDLVVRAEETPAMSVALASGDKVGQNTIQPAHQPMDPWQNTVPIVPKSIDESGPNTVLRQELANEENSLEVASINDWYEKNNVTHFRTEAAVLVVDDDVVARRYIASRFLDLNYRVDFAVNGAQALEMLRQNRYNAVFLDTHLPDMDGHEVCRQIKSRTDRRKVAVIFISSKNSTVDRVRGSMSGCDAYLTKPLNQERLSQVLDKFMPNWRINIPLV